MKCYIVLAALSLLTTLPATACDVCGCGLGSYYLGIAPQFEKHSLGLRYRSAAFRTHPDNPNSLFASEEVYRVIELSGRFYLRPDWQLQLNLPYTFNEQQLVEEVKQTTGFGDATLMLNRRLLNLSHFPADRLLQQQLWLGVGLKLPTGKFRYEPQDVNTVANANFQPGSGSFDPLLQLNYLLRYGKAGFSALGVYQLPTANAQGYRFGNRATAQAAFFVVQQLKKVGFMPALRMVYEHARSDKENRMLVKESGGRLLATSISLSTYYKNIALGAEARLPLKQQLAQGHIEADERFMLQLSYQF